MKVRLLGVGLSGFDQAEAPIQDALFSLDEDGNEAVAPLIADEQKRRGLISATDALKDRFGENAVRFGHELRNQDNLTGSSSKNPADYK